MSMVRLALMFAASAAALLPVVSQARPVNLEERMLLRCSAAFALVSFGQQNGDADFTTYPDIQQRGREYFVRASARVMEAAGIDRARISELLSTEAQDMLDNNSLDEVMQVCLPLLPPQ